MDDLLRDYQREMLDRLHESWRAGVRSVMLQMPTGTGKTHLMAAVIREYAGCGVLVVAHRIELIEQISRILALFGVEHGRIVRGMKSVDGHPVQVASVQTLSRHPDALSLQPSLVVIDEAHHALAKTYSRLWTHWRNARFVGFTATPCRLNHNAFTDLFEVLLQSRSIAEFIRQGWLSDFEYVSVSPESKAVERVDSLQKRGPDGDYQMKEMATVMDCPESIAHLFASYSHFAAGRKGIVYAIDCQHARHIAECYSAHGICCCVIDGKTPAAERKALVEDYRNGKISVLVSVDCFSEGFDCPEVGFIQLARPTLSLSKYLQQVGRGMRTGEKKSHVLILDQVGSYRLFGLPTDERDWERMFSGKLAGKGNPDMARAIVLRNGAMDKTLLNLEMVHIKRRGECHEGLEIFIQNGRYGVMSDGQVTCKALFERMTALEPPYFSMATYPYLVFRSKKTIIDGDGHDLRAELYGPVERNGDFFRARDVAGKTVYWDAKGGRTYAALPEVVRVGRFEMIKLDNRYMLRQQVPELNFTCTKEDIYFSPQLTVFRDMVVVRLDVKHPYRIYGYMPDGIVVGNKDCGYKGQYILLREDGRLSVDYQEIPRGLKARPDAGILRLRRMD